MCNVIILMIIILMCNVKWKYYEMILMCNINVCVLLLIMI